MLRDKVKSIQEEIQKVRADLATEIEAQTPVDPLGNGVKFTVIKFSELQDNVWCASYYLTGTQLQRVSEYIKDRAEQRTLETILNALQTIVDKGSHPAFSGLLFNKQAREIIASVL